MTSETIDEDLNKLHYAVNHVFLPPKLPQEDDLTTAREHGLCSIVHLAAETYGKYLPFTQKAAWERIVKMLKNVRDSQDTSTL